MRLWLGGIQQRASAEKESTAARRADCDWFHWREAHKAAFLLLSFLKIFSGRLKRKQTQRALFCWSNILALSFHACKLKPAQASELRIKRRDQTLSRERWPRDYGDILTEEQRAARSYVSGSLKTAELSVRSMCESTGRTHRSTQKWSLCGAWCKKTVETTSFNSLPLHSVCVCVCSSLYHL